MKYLILSILAAIIVFLYFVGFIKSESIPLLVIIIAIFGYFYQSDQNRKRQNLQNKRDSYANLMEELAIFKITGGKTEDDMKKATIIHFRSWADTSDEINRLLLKYFEAYREWSETKNEASTKNEKQAFNDLTQRIKKEIIPKSKEKFVPFYFKLN